MIQSLGLPAGTNTASQDVASSLLSDEALSIIQNLQAQLVHTSWHLREAEAAAKKRFLAAEEQHVHFGEVRDRHHEEACKLLQLEQEHEEEAQYRRVLSERLAMTQEELLEAKERHSRLVPGRDCKSIREELGRLRAQLAEAQEDGQSLRARLEDAKARSQRKMERALVNQQEADMKRQSHGHARAARLSAAKDLSAKAVQEQRGADCKVQADKLSQLTEQKSQLESDVQTICKQNISLEQRLETLRTRNRQLEMQLKKQQSGDNQKEAILQNDLRKLMQRLRVLTDVMKLPTDVTSDVLRPGDLDDAFSGSGCVSTTTSPAPSAYASTSSMAGAWSSRRSLAPALSAEGLNEQGNLIETASSSSLSHAATKAIATRSSECVSSVSLRSVSDGIIATFGARESSESNSACNVESRDYAIKSPVPSSGDHLDSSITRTPMLLPEVQALVVGISQE